MKLENYVYEIDAHDRIIYVNQDWVNFAEANQASDLSRAVLGSSIWSHVYGPEITHIYEALLQRLRHENRILTFPFRCDSPGIRRFFQMKMRPQLDDEVEFVCTLLGEEPRDEVELLNPTAQRDDNFIVMCSWCKKVQASGWVEVEEAIIRLHLFDQPLLPNITHGICLNCKHTLLNLG